MVRRIRKLVAVMGASLMVTQYSCTTTLGTELRDAAIDGAAGFVETATLNLLDRLFDADLAE